MHVGARLSDVYIQASRATSRNLSLQEQIKECAKDMIEEPSLNIQFTLKSFLLDYMQSMTGEDKSVCLGLRQSELKTHGVDLEAFKGLTVDAEMLGTIIATVWVWLG